MSFEIRNLAVAVMLILLGFVGYVGTHLQTLSDGEWRNAVNSPERTLKQAWSLCDALRIGWVGGIQIRAVGWFIIASVILVSGLVAGTISLRGNLVLAFIIISPTAGRTLALFEQQVVTAMKVSSMSNSDEKEEEMSDTDATQKTLDEFC